ncbi:type VI secretion system Vgr family protein [Sphingomonas sp. UYAg733]
MSGATSRLTKMSIDVGEQVVLERIEATETLSRPFVVTAAIISPLEIDLQPHLGKPTALAVLEDEQVLRHFHGLIVSAEYAKESSSGHHYTLTLQPWTYFLSHNRDMAIFQDLTAVQIIKQVFETAGVSDVDYSRLTKPRVTRGYTVQYRESDFTFTSRLMEEEGIYYYFKHDADRHVMVLCEGPQGHVPGVPASLEYNPNSVSVFAAESTSRFTKTASHLQSFTERVSTSAESKVTYRDFDFESPDKPLNAMHAAQGSHPRDDREVFLYPGRYTREKTGREDQEKTGQDRSRTILDALRANRRVFSGTSQASGLSCGSTVAVTGHPADRMNASYLISATFHSIAAETYRSGDQDDEVVYNVRFDAIPADTVFQAPQITPRPTVQGLESAIVTGPAGETIYTDEYGRVKVRFHWDRGATPGEKSTCWIRVSQTGGLGNLILPRVGHEVLVDFLHGDPDRPLVVGRVFNKSHMPIYDLPANKTRALWRTQRYGDSGQYPQTRGLDTGAPGANEIRFEDKGGVEEMFVHAERDMNVRVRFDQTHHVGHNQGKIVGYDRTIDVGHDERGKIGNIRFIEVVVDDTLKVGKHLVIDAGESILLKVGQSHVFITQDAISISAGNVYVRSKLDMLVSGMNTVVKAGAELLLKGVKTMINP